MSVIYAALVEEIQKAVDKTADSVLKEAQVMSQGPISEKALAKEDHPYARRHGSPLRDPSIINEQTGAFLRDWRKDAGFAELDSQDIGALVINENPVADYLDQPEGSPNSKMFRRPIKDKLEEFGQAMLVSQIGIALANFENKTITI